MCFWTSSRSVNRFFRIPIKLCARRLRRRRLSASAVTDIFYVLRKALQSPQQAKERVEQLAALVTFADVTGMDIHTALSREMQDFEDAVVDAVAERNEADCILTRNTKDFAGSIVPAVTPSDFLNS